MTSTITAHTDPTVIYMASGTYIHGSASKVWPGYRLYLLPRRAYVRQDPVGRRVYYLFSFQVTPSFVSFTSKPAAERASRILSLVVQSFSALALARNSSTMSTTLP